MTETGQVNDAGAHKGGSLPVIGIAERLSASRPAGKPVRPPRRGNGGKAQSRLWLIVLLVVVLLAGGGFAVYHFAFAAEKKPASDPEAIATCVANLGELNTAIDAYVAKNLADPPSLGEVAKQGFVTLPSCPSGGIYSLKMVMTKDGARLRAVCSVHGSEEQAKQMAAVAPAL